MAMCFFCMDRPPPAVHDVVKAFKGPTVYVGGIIHKVGPQGEAWFNVGRGADAGPPR